MTWTDFESLHPGLMRPAGTGPRFDISAYAGAALDGLAPERFIASPLPGPDPALPLLATADHEP